MKYITDIRAHNCEDHPSFYFLKQLRIFTVITLSKTKRSCGIGKGHKT